jgi:hypothetical protein
MNYFTPDLIVRGQSEDSRVLNEVETLWDERCARYDAYLASIQGELPPGLPCQWRWWRRCTGWSAGASRASSSPQG